MTIDDAARIFMAIKSDPKLSDLFSKVLEQGSFSQQHRISRLLDALEKKEAEEEVLEFVRLLGDPEFAQKFYSYLQKDEMN